EGQRAASQALREGFAFDVFHDEIVGAVFVADVIEDADVGMIQRGDGFCFAVESLARLGLSCGMVGQNFYGDNAVEASVAGAIDFAHAAAAKNGKDLVWAQTLSGSNRHSSPLRKGSLSAAPT